MWADTSILWRNEGNRDLQEHSRIEETENAKTLKEGIIWLIEKSMWDWNKASKKDSDWHKPNLGGSFSSSKELVFYSKCNGKLETISSHIEPNPNSLLWPANPAQPSSSSMSLPSRFLCSAIWCYFHSLNMSSLFLPQDICTCSSLAGVYFPQIFPWLATSHHSRFNLKIISLGKASLAVLVSEGCHNKLPRLA